MTKWSEFEQAHDFENLIFDLTQQSIAMAMAADLPHKRFAAFAFNCSSYSGDISLSFGVDPGYEDKRRRHRMYPPDWEYEAMESDVEAIGALWTAEYAPVQEAYSALTEAEDDCDAFCTGFLQSLRRVMVRLERAGALKPLGDQPVWTLVTEIDADTPEEEKLLERERARQAAA